MSLLQQIIQLLSQPPANIVYHLVTLFALQAIFGISLGQWRRTKLVSSKPVSPTIDQQDQVGRAVWRTVLAAGGIFLAQVLLLLAGLVWQNDPVTAVTILPPLEQALHTVTAVLLIWALVPPYPGLHRLGDTLVVVALIVIGVMTLFFVQNWQPQALAGLSYNSTPQATVWGLAQLILLVAGLALLLVNSATRRSLHPIIIGLLLLATVAHFWNYPEIIPTDTDIPYWLRLGRLVVFPLWTVLAYHNSLRPLLVLPAESASFRPAGISQLLRLATRVIDSPQPEPTLQEAIHMAARTMTATFAGIALADENDPQHLRLTSNMPQAGGVFLQQATLPKQGNETTFVGRPRSWNLNLSDWPAFRLALERHDSEEALEPGVELLPQGLGARQLHHLYEEMGLPPLGAMLIYPLRRAGDWLGFLLLARTAANEQWPAADRALGATLADYLARALANSREYAAGSRQLTTGLTLPEAQPLESGSPATMTEPDQVTSGRLIALEEERNRLLAELETAESRIHQTELRAAEARKQAQDLAATIEELERQNRDEHVVALEAEIASLRESLIAAEEAMAIAAAGEGGLSTEWVMMTITRYSSQLEAAQAQIQALEAELSRHDRGTADEVLTSLAQELRTPMTSIAGYTDLLLSEIIGILGAKQREFLQRVKANTERMGTLLDQIIQLTTSTEQMSLAEEAPAQVAEVLETAVQAVITQIREKHQRLEIDVEDDLPPLAMNRHTLQQILVHLLDNASRASGNNGRISVSAHARSIALAGSGRSERPTKRRNFASSVPSATDKTHQPQPNANHKEPFNFMHLAISDSGGGIRVDDRARVFNPQHRADNPLIPGLGDTGAGLAVVHSLTVANGGRIWVDSTLGQGSTFSLLFPITHAKAGGDEHGAASSPSLTTESETASTKGA